MQTGENSFTEAHTLS